MTEGKKEFFNSLIKIFGFMPMLHPDPYPVIAAYFEEHEIDESHMQDYLQNLYDYLLPRCKNRDAFISFFATSLTTKYNLDRWWTQIQMSQKLRAEDVANAEQSEVVRQAELVTCPVCGCRHHVHDIECPVCHSSADCSSSDIELSIARDVWALRQTDPNKAEAYEDECWQIMTDMLDSGWMRLSPAEKNKVNDETTRRLKQIRVKYLGAVA